MLHDTNPSGHTLLVVSFAMTGIRIRHESDSNIQHLARCLRLDLGVCTAGLLDPSVLPLIRACLGGGVAAGGPHAALKCG